MVKRVDGSQSQNWQAIQMVGDRSLEPNEIFDILHIHNLGGKDQYQRIPLGRKDVYELGDEE